MKMAFARAFTLPPLHQRTNQWIIHSSFLLFINEQTEGSYIHPSSSSSSMNKPMDPGHLYQSRTAELRLQGGEGGRLCSAGYCAGYLLPSLSRLRQRIASHYGPNELKGFMEEGALLRQPDLIWGFYCGYGHPGCD